MEWHPARWSVCLPLLIFPCTMQFQKFSSGTDSPGWSRKKGRKTVVVVIFLLLLLLFQMISFNDKRHRFLHVRHPAYDPTNSVGASWW